MLRSLFTTIWIPMGVFLAGCDVGRFMPTIAPVPTPQETASLEVNVEPAITPLDTTAAIRSEPPSSSGAGGVLDRAVMNLLDAASFEMAAHVVSAYQVLGANGGSDQVYGEFHSKYVVIRLPLLKVYGKHEYRYDPQADYFSYEWYSYQENDKYFTRFFDPSGNSAAMQIEPHSIEPFSSDVYETLVNYSDVARYETESDGMAVYVLEHPKWYLLESAIGFADLGFLHGQENGEQLVEQYVREHYPNVATVEFTIFVAVDELLITRVEVDNRAFMRSFWDEVDRALIEQGAEVESLARYVLTDEHKSEYAFSNYNQVEDFDLFR